MKIKGLEVITAVSILPPCSLESARLYVCLFLRDVVCTLICTVLFVWRHTVIFMI